jgi:urocanate hydratase
MEKELVLKIIANGEGIQTEFKRASSSIHSDVYETDKWMHWMDFDTNYKQHIEKALKNIPLQGIATELDWNQLILLLTKNTMQLQKESNF